MKKIYRICKKVALCAVLFVAVALAGYLGFCTYRTYQADLIYARIAGSEWIGSWQSEGVGDSGALKLKLEHVTGNKYRTIWLAEHFGVFKASFDEVLDVVIRDEGALYLDGSIDLGIEGGIFRYNGSIKDDLLKMKWKSSTDRGRLELRRVDANDVKFEIEKENSNET